MLHMYPIESAVLMLHWPHSLPACCRTAEQASDVSLSSASVAGVDVTQRLLLSAVVPAEAALQGPEPVARLVRLGDGGHRVGAHAYPHRISPLQLLPALALPLVQRRRQTLHYPCYAMSPILPDNDVAHRRDVLMGAQGL